VLAKRLNEHWDEASSQDTTASFHGQTKVIQSTNRPDIWSDPVEDLVTRFLAQNEKRPPSRLLCGRLKVL
jgi:hypothetical protein